MRLIEFVSPSRIISTVLSEHTRALRTIGKRLETLPRNIVFDEIIDRKTALTLSALDALEASKSVLQLSSDADQRVCCLYICSSMRSN
jgi:hypothetical protein